MGKKAKKAKKRDRQATAVGSSGVPQPFAPYVKYGKEAVVAELQRIAQGKPRHLGNLEKMSNKAYEAAMAPLQVGLVELQETSNLPS